MRVDVTRALVCARINSPHMINSQHMINSEHMINSPHMINIQYLNLPIMALPSPGSLQHGVLQRPCSSPPDRAVASSCKRIVALRL